MSAQGSPAAASGRRLFPWNRTPVAKSPVGETAAAAKPVLGKTGRETAQAATKAAGRREQRRPFDYAGDARPERQRGVATFLPTRFSRLALLAGGILLATATTIVLGGWPRAIDVLAGLAGPRFTRTIAALRACVDLRGPALGGWLAQILLLAAAIVAWAIRGIRRHRKDGRHGRSRAWLSMGALLFVAALAGVVPIGRLTGAILTDATGVAFGPEGLGWWVAISGVTSAIACLWTILPLHQRIAPACWLLAGMAGWTATAACRWIGEGREEYLVGGSAAWVAGAAALCIAMLTAARGVIREARGEIKAPPAPAVTGERKTPKSEPVAAAARSSDPAFEPIEAETDGETDGESDGESEPDADIATSDTGYTDGSDAEDDYAARPLSKAEKKRLRKMARMGQAA